MPPRTAIVGDVHGCLTELRQLLALVGSVDRVVFLGDLLDKGPEGPETVAYVRGMGAVCIMGNHEESNARYESGIRREGVSAMTDRTGDYASNYGKLSPSDYDWIRGLPLYARVGRFLCVHAGIDARGLPPYDTLSEGMTSKMRKQAAGVLRVRNVDARGYMVALRDITPDHPYWADVYDGSLGHILFGHSPFDEVMRFPHATGIDTGCVYGGRLSALITDGEAILDVVSVRAETVYARDYSGTD